MRAAPLAPAPASVRALQQRTRWRALAVLLALLALSVLAGALLLWLPGNQSVAILAAAVVPAMLIWIWRDPVRSVYLLFGAAVVQETQWSAITFPDDLGRYLPIFQDITTWTSNKNLSFSIAEVFMLLALLIWVLTGIARRTLRFERGTLLLPLGLYMCMVLVGELHGMATGGNFKTSLWELRPQVYMLVAYVLACNLVRTRKQIDTILWILLVGAGLKGIQGTWRLVFSLHGDVSQVESLFPHEQSFFFNGFLVLTPLLFLYGGSPRMKRAALCFLPFVAVASLANQRRAAVLAFGLAVVLLLLITMVVHARRRQLMFITIFVLSVLLPPYYLYFSNQNGLLAEPARAVASAFHPDQRDNLSDIYRVNEDKDIMATVHVSPIIGYGFGKPMLVPYALADISGLYVFWNIMPHDSVLWVWMRMGTIGFFFFWLLIGSSLLRTAGLAQRFRDPYLKGIAVLFLLLIIQQIVFSYLDMQWTIYRNLIALGVIFALIGNLERFARIEEAGDDEDHVVRLRGAA